jgi:peptidoglycan/LPS O-acetylase OafA/YrhL
MDNFATRHVPELDGLRGIAILSVIIHHQLTPFSMSGGFLGVDLFFVLSGFLITSLLAAEFENTKAISLKNFYLRRVLRLGPALVVYLAGCLAVTLYTHEITLSRQLKLIFLALVYATNWRMAFAWDTTLDPTAIIWSLSIEEQFYLVWPVIFLACTFLKIKRQYVSMGLAVVIIAILTHRFRLLNSGVELTRLYYGTDTRADALLTGCLVALIPTNILNPRTKRWFLWVSLVAAISLSYLMLRIDFSSPFLYSGGLTLIAALCGCLIFAAAYVKTRLMSAVLGFQLLRWLGRISYGLYLWHWLVVRNTSFYYLGKWEPWTRVALALAIASASYYIIERPFNRLKRRFGSGATADTPTTKVVPFPASLPTRVLPTDELKPELVRLTAR